MTTQAKKSKRPLVFLAIGILNTLLDFAFYTLITQTVFKGVDLIVTAGIVSGTFALLCAFTTHSLITWSGRKKNKKTIIRFIVFTGFGLWVIRPILLATFILLTPVYDFAFAISTSLHLPFSHSFIANTGAFGFMAVILLTYNYLVYDRFVFTEQHETQEAKDNATDS